MSLFSVRFRQEFDVLESNATTKSSPQSSNSISISKKGTNKTQQTKTTNASVTTSSAFNNQPFSPEYFYELLPKFNPISSLWHEDSQEFLCFLLDSLHSELVQGNFCFFFCFLLFSRGDILILFDKFVLDLNAFLSLLCFWM